MASVEWHRSSVCRQSHCPDCGGKTVLIVDNPTWEIASDDSEDEDSRCVEPRGLEITARFCQECHKVTSLCANMS